MDLLSNTNMLDCKPLSIPLLQNTKFDDQGDLDPNPSLYWKIIRKLMYLTVTRPDIQF